MSHNSRSEILKTKKEFYPLSSQPVVKSAKTASPLQKDKPFPLKTQDTKLSIDALPPLTNQPAVKPSKVSSTTQKNQNTKSNANALPPLSRQSSVKPSKPTVQKGQPKELGNQDTNLIIEGFAPLSQQPKAPASNAMAPLLNDRTNSKQPKKKGAELSDFTPKPKQLASSQPRHKPGIKQSRTKDTTVVVDDYPSLGGEKLLILPNVQPKHLHTSEKQQQNLPQVSSPKSKEPGKKDKNELKKDRKSDPVKKQTKDSLKSSVKQSDQPRPPINTAVAPAIVTWNMDHYPMWGGSMNVDPFGSVSFSNTCPIDGWLVIFHSLYQDNKLVRARINKPDCKLLQEFEGLYLHGKFNEIKKMLLKINSIGVRRHVADFFGNEFIYFVKHIDVLFKSQQVSTCTSNSCPKKERIIACHQSLGWCDPNTTLKDTVISWLQETFMSNCTQDGR